MSLSGLQIQGLIGVCCAVGLVAASVVQLTFEKCRGPRFVGAIQRLFWQFCLPLGALLLIYNALLLAVPSASAPLSLHIVYDVCFDAAQVRWMYPMFPLLEFACGISFLAHVFFRHSLLWVSADSFGHVFACALPPLLYHVGSGRCQH